ncbi:Crp/Fnr family transcriptional regulator [Roseibium sp.]|uniref:Crp/Fnr family transcriptional regulator n=1 Tax=Roseibium sp. TaxID=1936156 RepID=UPI003B51CB40
MTDQEAFAAFSNWLRETGGVSSETAAAARTHAEVRRFEREDSLFAAGDRPKCLYFVQSGLVRFYYLTRDGKEYNKSFATEGGVVTSMSTFLSEAPSPFHTQALEETITVALPMEFVRKLAATDLSLERLVNRFVVQLAVKKEQREASFLLMDAGERYELFLDDFADLAPRLPQYHIASYLGITPVALSRIRARRTGRRAS